MYYYNTYFLKKKTISAFFCIIDYEFNFWVKMSDEGRGGAGLEEGEAFRLEANPSWREEPLQITFPSVGITYAGCSLNIVVFFPKILKYIPDSGLSQFFLDVYNRLHAWTTKWQVEGQRCSRTDRVKKNHNILWKKLNI